mmetsp:Transcript_5243/g.4577  ORF Transcript_5243/g.4577 Transcript_5243/m.4577 type:complete len:246 (+) Transcript_5243:3-740(+)
MGLCAYIMICGRIPSWTDFKTKLGQQDLDGLFLITDKPDITESMQRLIKSLLDRNLERKYTLNEILLFTSSEALFLRGCDNFNSRPNNLAYLFSGFVREMENSVYNRTPNDIIRLCVGFTYDEDRWEKIDGKEFKGEEKLDKTRNHCSFHTPKQWIIMRRMWEIKVENVDNGSILKLVDINIDDSANTITVPAAPVSGDVITVLFVRGKKDLIRVALNGKEFNQQGLNRQRPLSRLFVQRRQAHR